MKKTVLIFCVFASCMIQNLSAQLLWRVTGGELSRPTYLLGTHHLIESSRIPNFNKILKYLSQTEMVIGELDLSDKEALQIELMQSAIMPDTVISQLLSSSQYILVDSVMKQNLGVDLETVQHLKPAMLAMMYETGLYAKKVSPVNALGSMDVLIQQEAQKQSKPIMGFESIEVQTQLLFGKISLQRQAQQLVETILESDSLLSMIPRLNEVYVHGNLSELVRMMNEEKQWSENEKELLLFDRNTQWVKELNRIMRRKSCFVAVGCLHLVGDKGMITLLRKAGFRVEAVTW